MIDAWEQGTWEQGTLEAPKREFGVDISYVGRPSHITIRRFGFAAMTTLRQALDRALQLHESGRLGEAEILYRQILGNAPDHAETLHLLGALAHQCGRDVEAAELIVRAIAQKGDVPVFHNSLGIAYRALKRFNEAESSYRRALLLDPDFAEALSNLGNLMHQKGDLDAALKYQRRARDIEPGRAEFHSNLGTSLYDCGDLAAAEDCYRRAISLKPDYADAHFHLGVIRLHRGDFREGWREYEWRWRASTFEHGRRDFKQPQWRGEDLKGAHILLYPEQGFGDTLQFVRYVKQVAASGGRVWLESPPELLRLLTRIEGAERVFANGTAPADFAWQCPLMSLPFAFGTELATVPVAIPYLAAEPEAASWWRQRLAARPGLRVGITWAGRRTHRRDRARSFSPAHLAPLADIKGAAFYSLQKEAATIPAWAEDLTPGIGDFADTAAAISALDLVVTADTAVAHLAGALGTPVFILLPWISDWRWLEARADSPWYPTARLFRQQIPHDWGGVVTDVVQAIGQFPTNFSRLNR
jgi:tetratricopeptide (TPR) repeat protein